MTGQHSDLVAQLTRVRKDPHRHWIALVVSIGIGLVLASVHWLGLVVGGALVGLVSTSLVRALFAGIGFGLLVLLVWTASLWITGSLSRVLEMGEFGLVAVAIALVAPAVGSLLRGVV